MKINSSLLILCFMIAITGCKKDPIVLNSVPIVTADSSKTITLPTNSITLSGSGKDTDGQIVAYLWSQISGPDATTIVNSGSQSTLVTGFAKGNYVFQLMVTDNDGATGVDTVSVTVNAPIEQTVTLQPDNNPDEKMFVTVGGEDQSFEGGNEWVIDAWTIDGKPYVGRKAFKFDLSNIPSGATIISAHLFLYSNNPPENGNFTDPNFGISNGLILQQITSDWSPSTADWYNQPQVSTANQILIPSTTQSVLDLNINVTNLVSSMVKNNSDYGFLLRLQNETAYNSRMFVSSYNAAKPQKHPKIVITYRL